MMVKRRVCVLLWRLQAARPRARRGWATWGSSCWTRCTTWRTPTGTHVCMRPGARLPPCPPACMHACAHGRKCRLMAAAFVHNPFHEQDL